MPLPKVLTSAKEFCTTTGDTLTLQNDQSLGQSFVNAITKAAGSPQGVEMEVKVVYADPTQTAWEDRIVSYNFADPEHELEYVSTIDSSTGAKISFTEATQLIVLGISSHNQFNELHKLLSLKDDVFVSQTDYSITSLATVEPLSDALTVVPTPGTELKLIVTSNIHISSSAVASSQRSRLYLYYRNSSDVLTTAASFRYVGLANRSVANAAPTLYIPYIAIAKLDGSMVNSSGSWEVSVHGRNDYVNHTTFSPYSEFDYREKLVSV